MKRLIGRAAIWLSDSLKPVILWAAGVPRDPKAPWRYLVGGFSVHREFAVESAEKKLKKG
jgi:hypothetical protein